MQAVALVPAPWRAPIAALSAIADEPWALGLISGGAGGRWSYVMGEPDAVLWIGPDAQLDAFAALREFAGPAAPGAPGAPDGPPFQGGVAGLLSYELGDRVEPLGLARLDGWPDLACGRYPAVLAFDHQARRLVAVGRGATTAEAETAARRALAWLDRPAPPAPPHPLAGGLGGDDPRAYERAVSEVVGRIRAGEIFQANLARRWRATLAGAARPFDLLAALALSSPAPFAAYLRLRDRAVVSNSPERFVQAAPAADGAAVQTWPIKGTAPRGRSEAEDARLASDLRASSKDLAENLMIVDLMRNDLARVCRPGSVQTPELFQVQSFVNVHHLVSRVTGRLRAGLDAVDLLQAAFPPGSITGAPKVQAMKVIAGLEAPRGPFFGSMLRLGFDGALDSSVLIRTAALVQAEGGWRLEARAGAGLVCDSDPVAERRETETKISALAAALGGRLCDG